MTRAGPLRSVEGMDITGIAPLSPDVYGPLPAAHAAELASAWGLMSLVAIVVLGQIVLFISALASILGSHRYTGGGKLLWVVVVFCFPFVGAIAWWAAGRRAAIRTTEA
jgi:hypothetical protein